MATMTRFLGIATFFISTIVCVGGGSSTDHVIGCPRTCFCNVLSRIVYCSRRGLLSIPETLPAIGGKLTLWQLNLNGNHFRSSVLQRANFSTSHVASIEHLYMSDCGIELIEVDAFANLVRLRWLDLSENRLRVIPSGAFRGLSLQHLFLNGNRNIQLVLGSFDGLATSGLYLHDCALAELSPEVLSPLIAPPTERMDSSTLSSISSPGGGAAGLVNLWLNGNRLTHLDRRLADVFRSLSHLRLGGNPLHCNCETRWLRTELYDVGGGAVFRGAEPPTCGSPARLRGITVGDLKSVNAMTCRAPTFGNIDVQFDDDREIERKQRGSANDGERAVGGKLRCTASGDPAPTVYWIRPSGKAVRYDPRHRLDFAASSNDVNGDIDFNEGVLLVDSTSGASGGSAAISGMYICIANNEAGNVTLTVNVSWPNIVPDVVRSTIDRPNSNAIPRETVTQRADLGSTFFPVPVLSLAVDEKNQKNRLPHGKNTRTDDGIVYRVLTMPVGQNSNTVTSSPSSTVESSSREFTGFELATAVICTHIMTLIVVALTMVLCQRRRQAARRLDEMAAIINQPRAQNEMHSNGCRGGKPAVIVEDLLAQRFLSPVTGHDGGVISRQHHVGNGYLPSTYHQSR